MYPGLIAMVDVEAKWVQTQLDRTSVEPIPPEHLPVSGETAALIHISVLLGWTIAVFTYLTFSKTTREAVREAEFRLFHAHKVPCQQCRFYTSNPHLKCAVHPMTAMTKQAIDCSDYQTQSTIAGNPPAQNQVLRN